MPDAAATADSIVDTFRQWAKQPFDPNMDIGGWFAFFGLILALAVGWGLILHDLKGEL